MKEKTREQTRRILGLENDVKAAETSYSKDLSTNVAESTELNEEVKHSAQELADLKAQIQVRVAAVCEACV